MYREKVIRPESWICNLLLRAGEGSIYVLERWIGSKQKSYEREVNFEMREVYLSAYLNCFVKECSCLCKIVKGICCGAHLSYCLFSCITH